MMRILVVSDTHGDYYALREVLRMERRAELVIHLGDGEDDVSQVKAEFPEKQFLQVRGNNDWGSRLETAQECKINGIKIFYTHGHTYNVKLGEYALLSAARDRKANIVLYGHTHTPDDRFEDGLYIMNPGALGGRHGTYGILDIDDNGGILPAILHP